MSNFFAAIPGGPRKIVMFFSVAGRVAPEFEREFEISMAPRWVDGMVGPNPPFSKLERRLGADTSYSTFFSPFNRCFYWIF